MTYKQEFPAFDDVLPTLEGFKDSSWHNDACPSLIKELGNENFLQVFVDWKNKEMSDFADFVQPAPKATTSAVPKSDLSYLGMPSVVSTTKEPFKSERVEKMREEDALKEQEDAEKLRLKDYVDSKVSFQECVLINVASSMESWQGKEY